MYSPFISRFTSPVVFKHIGWQAGWAVLKLIGGPDLAWGSCSRASSGHVEGSKGHSSSNLALPRGGGWHGSDPTQPSPVGWRGCGPALQEKGDMAQPQPSLMGVGGRGIALRHPAWREGCGPASFSHHGSGRGMTWPLPALSGLGFGNLTVGKGSCIYCHHSCAAKFPDLQGSIANNGSYR